MIQGHKQGQINLLITNMYNTGLHVEGSFSTTKYEGCLPSLNSLDPPHLNTMMTSIAFAYVYTRNIGQQFVVFTCDLHLYRVALEVQWTYPERLSNVILRLVGMHSLMSFIGYIRISMADTGLSDIMASVIGGLSKMLTGKKIPQDVRALRMVAEEVLRVIIQDTSLHCSGDLMHILETEANKRWSNLSCSP